MTKKEAQKIGIILAEHLFEDMLNPDFQGPKFQWKNFPKMAAKRALTHLFLYTNDTSSTISRHLKKVAAEAAQAKAQELVDNLERIDK